MSHISPITMQSLGYPSSSVRLCDRKLDMMIHSYSSRNWDIEARVLKVIGQPVLCREIYNKIKIKSVNISMISSAWHSKACLHFSSLLVLPSPSSTIKLLHSPNTSHLGLLSLWALLSSLSFLMSIVIIASLLISVSKRSSLSWYLKFLKPLWSQNFIFFPFQLSFHCEDGQRGRLSEKDFRNTMKLSNFSQGFSNIGIFIWFSFKVTSSLFNLMNVYPELNIRL